MPKLTEIASILKEQQRKPTTFLVVLRVLRRINGMAAWQVANQVCISESTYERIERGKRDVMPDELQRLDEIHGCQGELIDFRFGRIKLSLEKTKSRLLQRQKGRLVKTCCKK